MSASLYKMGQGRHYLVYSLHKLTRPYRTSSAISINFNLTDFLHGSCFHSQLDTKHQPTFKHAAHFQNRCMSYQKNAVLHSKIYFSTCVCGNLHEHHQQHFQPRIYQTIVNHLPSLQGRCRLSTSVYGVTEGTIFSLSSGHGKCGVAVIRVSGSQTRAVLQTMCTYRKLPTPRKAVVRSLVDPLDGTVIDKGLIIYFPGPESFTGEDCLELQVHGGPAVVSAILSALHKVPGCRQAEPGEFTKRAFLNTKLDLTEVEGLGDLIHAETESQRRQALRQMGGALSQLYTHWRSNIIKCVADLEAYIDFSEDQGIEQDIIDSVSDRVVKLQSTMTEHLNDDRKGERLREGVHVTIIGKPNVGKSSLLNAICQRPAAIVTEIAGTTRDVIETPLNIGGYPVLLNDTAGLQPTEDKVEKEGIKRAMKRAKEADIRVLVLDLNELTPMDQLLHNDSFQSFLVNYVSSMGFVDETCQSLTDDRFHRSHSSDNVEFGFLRDIIIVLNKSDLFSEIVLENVKESFKRLNIDHQGMSSFEAVHTQLNKSKENTVEVNNVICADDREQETGNQCYTKRIPVCCISCITGDGLDVFLNVLKRKVAHMCGNPLLGHPSLTQARHRAHLTKCLENLDHFHHMLALDDIVLASEALRGALREVGKISGKITSEDILDVIFKDFCIGK